MEAVVKVLVELVLLFVVDGDRKYKTNLHPFRFGTGMALVDMVPCKKTTFNKG